MARTIAECNDYIVSTLVSTFGAQGITITPTLWSKANLLRLICYSFAVVQALGEQLQDIAIAKMQAIQDVSTAATAPWLQDAIFKFQYSATTPQYLSIINGVLQYAVVNPVLRIVSACSISTTVTNVVNIKVAKGAPLGPLAAGELTALQNYVANKGTAGIVYNVTSTTSDKLYLKATIYYQGVYAAIIQANVIAAIDDYLVNLSKTRFGGDILALELDTYIRGLEGVNDVYIDRLSVRYNAQALFGGIDLVLDGDWINRKFTFGAGYAIQETTASNTFADTLTFTAE